MSVSPRQAKWIRYCGLIIFTFTIVILLAHPICDFVFACGCSGLWAGGADSCRHAPWGGGPAPFCPWCTMDHSVLALLGVLVVSLTLAASYPARHKKVWHHSALVLVVSVLFLIAFGIGTAIVYRYPMGILADWAPELCGLTLGGKEQ